ncbi:MAG TPA: fasciclin domain-containing protein [Flavisolibacter sp.]|nr:fasciclin domain-containing protein [Flavisolibacter sp.]
MVKGLKVTGLAETLEAEGSFTVFASTNLAFGKLDSGIVKDWEAGMHTPEL